LKLWDKIRGTRKKKFSRAAQDLGLFSSFNVPRCPDKLGDWSPYIRCKLHLHHWSCLHTFEIFSVHH
jgi:hypothetical protein